MAPALVLSMLLSTPSVTASDPSPDGPNVGGPTWGPHIEGVRADADLEQLLQDYGPVLGSRFAGAWLDSDGNAHVGITGGSVPKALAEHPKVRMIERRFPLDRLDAAIETVMERLNPLLAPRWDSDTRVPYRAGVNVWDNVVDVEVDESRADQRQSIEEALSDELEAGTVRIVGYDEPLYQRQAQGGIGLLIQEFIKDAEGRNRDDVPPPFRGGIETYNSSSPGCTLGFVMRNPVGVRFQSTAGHCTRTSGSDQWRHGSRNIGKTSQWGTLQDGHGIDFQTIWHNNQSEPVPTNLVYRDQNSATRITSKITTPNSDLHSNMLCTEGKVTGTQCGPLINHNTTVFWRDEHDNLRSRSGFGVMESPLWCKGDSGSPVIADSTRRAYGIAVFFLPPDDDEDAPCGSSVLFEWVPRVEDWSGRQVLLTTTTEGLGPGQRMNEGYSLRSRDGKSKLVMQNDGNLVVYRSGMGAVWATGTNGPNRVAIMQNDGNFVVYGPGGALWASGTSAPHRTARLMMQDDGNLVVYKGWTGLWACC